MKNRGKKGLPRSVGVARLLACLLAWLTACWLGSEEGRVEAVFIEIHAKPCGPTRGGVTEKGIDQSPPTRGTGA